MDCCKINGNKHTKPLSSGLSRRNFIKTASLIGLFTIVPRHVLGGNGHTPPSERVNIASIGLNGMGAIDLENVKDDNNIVALCDVDEQLAGPIFAEFPMARKYRDYRVMLDKQKDIDAVMIATPDHTHAVIAMAAIKAGKHVFIQKPLTHTIFEARQLTLAAREANVATQMGNQGQARENARLLREMLADNAIGTVRKAYGWTRKPYGMWPQGDLQKPKDTPPVPRTLDWDIWLGPAPYRDYHPAYHPFNWRGWWDFGTGGLGDVGCHVYPYIFNSLHIERVISVEASSSKFSDQTYPEGSIVRYQLASRDQTAPIRFTWYDGGLEPPRPDALEPNRSLKGYSQIYQGDKGTIIMGHKTGPRLIPESQMKAYKQPPKTLPRSPGHYKEWINACKGGLPAGSNFDVAGPIAEAVVMGNVAIRMRKKLLWDPVNMKFPNCPEADPYVHYEYREGWTL